MTGLDRTHVTDITHKPLPQHKVPFSVGFVHLIPITIKPNSLFEETKVKNYGPKRQMKTGRRGQRLKGRETRGMQRDMCRRARAGG